MRLNVFVDCYGIDMNAERNAVGVGGTSREEIRRTKDCWSESLQMEPPFPCYQ
jgi:hypothetical protein